MPNKMTFTELLTHLPGIWDSFEPDSRAALLGCNKQLHSWVHSLTKTIYMDALTTDYIPKLPWPELNLIVLHDVMDSGKGFGYYATVTCAWQLHCLTIVKLDSWHTGDYGIVLVVKPKDQQQCKGVLHKELPATVMAQLHNDKWQNIRQLTMFQTELTSEMLSQLTAIDWPRLAHVNIYRLHAVDIVAAPSYLVGSWPMLSSVSSQQVTPDKLKLMLDSPLLHGLDVSWNPLFSPAAHLPLNEFDNLSVAASSGDKVWAFTPILLAGAFFMSCLHIQGYTNKIGVASVQQLLKAVWPWLEHLDLSGNAFDSDAIRPLLQAQWPELKCLKLAGTSLGVQGVQGLCKAPWSKLADLTLDVPDAVSSTWTALRLDPKFLKKGKKVTDAQEVPRLASSPDEFHVFPALKHVKFESRSEVPGV